MVFFSVNNARNVSGCEENQLDLARWFRAQHGVRTVFLVREESALGDQAAQEGFGVRRVFQDGLGRLRTPFAIAQAIREERPAIISVNREHNIHPTWLALQLVRPFTSQRPLLVSVFHSPTGRRYPLLKLFDGIICTSEYTGEAFFANNHGLRERTAIIPYGTLLPPVDQAAKQDWSRAFRVFKGARRPLVGMVGDLWKNQTELLDVVEYLKGRFPTLTCAIVGAGSDEVVADLREKIMRKGLQDQIILAGRIARSRIPDLFFDFDVSLSVYRHEGFGIVHIESLAAMTPLVAYNNGGIREILRYGGGVLVEGGVAEFSAALEKLLADPEYTAALGLEGRHVVEQHFTMDIMCRRHYQYYAGLLERFYRQEG